MNPFPLESYVIPEDGSLFRIVNSEYHQMRLHYFPDFFEIQGRTTKALPCLKQFVPATQRYDGVCDLCSNYTTLWNLGKPNHFVWSDFESACRDIKPTERFYFNVIDRNAETGGVKILSCGKTIFNVIRDCPTIVGSTKFCDFTAADFVISKKLMNMLHHTYPDYSGSHFLSPSPMSSDSLLIDKWRSSLHDLSKLMIFDPIEDRNKVFEDYFGKLEYGKRKKRYRTLDDSWEQSCRDHSSAG